MDEVQKIIFRIKGTSPLLEDNFHGIEEEKSFKSLPDKQQAEKHLYRGKNKTIIIPSCYVSGCLRNEYILEAASKTKRSTEMFVCPRILISPAELDTGLKDFTLRKRPVPAGNMSRGGCMDMKVSPKLDEWEVEGTLITTLPYTSEEIRSKMEAAGVNVGLGADKKHGYGRFEVIEWKVQTIASTSKSQKVT